jgi:hypothetical protein
MSKVPARSTEVRADLAQRIARLEQRNEALEWRLVELVKLLSGNAGHHELLTAQAIKIRRVEIVDAEGTPRIMLSSTSDGAEIVMVDEFRQSVIAVRHHDAGPLGDHDADLPGRTSIRLAPGAIVETIDPEWTSDQLDGVACGICGARSLNMRPLLKVGNLEIFCCDPDCPST